MASFRKRGANWYYRYVSADGRQIEVKGCPNLRATQDLAREAEEKAAKERRTGETDRFEPHRRRPLVEHVNEYLAFLRSKGNTVKHVDLTETRLLAVIGGCGFKWLRDIDADAVSAWLTEQRAKGKGTKDPATGKPRGISAQTSNYYLQAVRGFTRWLVKRRRTPDNPLIELEPLNPKTDRRHDRAALTHDQFTALLAATRSADDFRRLSGTDRAMLYTVASYTGLRASELASLKPSSFTLNGAAPAVRVKAAYTKNRQDAVLPLHGDLVALLCPYLATIPAESPVWPGTWIERAARMLKADLTRAKIDYRDAAGRYYDFHSLRHRFGTELAMANVQPKVAQALMRHSTITLTLDRYSHVELETAAGGVAKLPTVPGVAPAVVQNTTARESESEATNETTAPETGAQPAPEPISERRALPLPYGQSPNEAEGPRQVPTAGHPVYVVEGPQVVTEVGFSDPESASVFSSGGGTRTPDTRIMIPLL